MVTLDKRQFSLDVRGGKWDEFRETHGDVRRDLALELSETRDEIGFDLTGTRPMRSSAQVVPKTPHSLASGRAGRNRPRLLIVVNHHHDPIWKRCFKRPIREHGFTHISYAKLEEYYIEDNLALARRHKGYRFHIESALVARTYVEQHPERLPELRRLVAGGRLLIKGAGENIVDTNLLTAESLIRNYVNGLMWVESVFGVRTSLATRTDGFGNSAQLPQILRGCEMSWAQGFAYYGLHKAYWRGLDGSCVFAGEAFGTVGWAGEGEGHVVACPACKGAGCAMCRYRGVPRERVVPLPAGLNEALLKQAGVGLVRFGSDEPFPNPAILDWARKMSRRYQVRFILETDLAPFVRDQLEQVAHPPAGQVQDGELNPTDSGVLVSRIRCKQTCRRQEYALLGAESLAALAARMGARFPRQDLLAAWRDLHLTQFHDAVTGTHTDAPHRELEQVWKKIDRRIARIRRTILRPLVSPRANIVSVINPFGHGSDQWVSVALPGKRPPVAIFDGDAAVPVAELGPAPGGGTRISFVARGVGPLGCKAFTVRRGRRRAGPRRLAVPRIENQRFIVQADEIGLASIFDKRLNRELMVSQPLRPAELVLERDFGSPWATMSPDRSRTGMSAQTRLVKAEREGPTQRLVFATPRQFHAVNLFGFAIDGIEATTTVALHEGLDRVDFATDLFWDTYGQRIRCAFPIRGNGRHFYEIPGGVLERKPYEPAWPSDAAPMACWHLPNGDWPTLNWAGVQFESHSVALLNRGLPSYRIEPGAGSELLLLSVVRSPICPTHLACPQNFTTDFDGMRDAGTHRFEYGLVAYGCAFAESPIMSDAEGYNAGLVAVAGAAHLPEAPRIAAKSVRITAFKRAEVGNALILRLTEQAGRQAPVTLTVPSYVKAVAKVNMLERQGQPVLVEAGQARLTLRPWEIATLRLDTQFQ